MARVEGSSHDCQVATFLMRKACGRSMADCITFSPLLQASAIPASIGASAFECWRSRIRDIAKRTRPSRNTVSNYQRYDVDDHCATKSVSLTSGSHRLLPPLLSGHLR